MSRQRFIHPEIWQSEQVMSLPLGARLLWIGIFSTADDEGRRKANPALLKAAIFPGDPTIGADLVRDWLRLVADSGLIRVYSDPQGAELLDIPNWAQYQKPKYRKPSRLAAFSESGPNPGRIVPEPGPNPAETAPGPDQTRSVGCGSGSGCGLGSGIQSPPLTFDVSVTGPPPSPVTAQSDTATPNGKRRSDETDAAGRPIAAECTATSAVTDAIVNGWITTEQYAKADSLLALVNLRDQDDPVTVLAHVLEIDATPEARSRCAMLWLRLLPPTGESPMIPSDGMLAEAKRRLSLALDAELRGGPIQSPSQALQAMVDTRSEEKASIAPIPKGTKRGRTRKRSTAKADA